VWIATWHRLEMPFWILISWRHKARASLYQGPLRDKCNIRSNYKTLAHDQACVANGIKHSIRLINNSVTFVARRLNCKFHNISFLLWKSCFLGSFANLRKATKGFVMSVRLFVRPPAWNTASTGRIFMKFYIWAFCRRSVEKIQFELKYDNNIGYFTWRRMYIYDNMSLSSS
jgi:hypothetical protein